MLMSSSILVTSRIILLGNTERTETSVEVITAGATLEYGIKLTNENPS